MPNPTPDLPSNRARIRLRHWTYRRILHRHRRRPTVEESTSLPAVGKQRINNVGWGHSTIMAYFPFSPAPVIATFKAISRPNQPIIGNGIKLRRSWRIDTANRQHFSHYGRICPIETSEGMNAGLILSLASLQSKMPQLIYSFPTLLPKIH